MTFFDILAIIGTSTGSIALLWDIFKWRSSQASISIIVSANMVEFGVNTSKLSNDKLARVTVINDGWKPVSITHLYLTYYDNMLKRLIGRHRKQFFVPSPEPGKIPTHLDLGEYWIGAFDQSDDVEMMAKEGVLMVEVATTGVKKTTKARLKIPKTKKP